MRYGGLLIAVQGGDRRPVECSPRGGLFGLFLIFGEALLAGVQITLQPWQRAPAKRGRWPTCGPAGGRGNLERRVSRVGKARRMGGKASGSCQGGGGRVADLSIGEINLLSFCKNGGSQRWRISNL